MLGSKHNYIDVQYKKWHEHRLILVEPHLT